MAKHSFAKQISNRALCPLVAEAVLKLLREGGISVRQPRRALTVPGFPYGHRWRRRMWRRAFASAVRASFAHEPSRLTGIMATTDFWRASSVSSAPARRAYGWLLPDIASMGWGSGQDPRRQEACLAGTISSLPARIPSQRSKDLRFAVVPDGQRPCRSPNRSVPSLLPLSRMLRWYEDRRSEFRHRFPKRGLRRRSSVPSSMPAPRGHLRLPRPCGPKW